jgi:hypothetical protein
MGSTLFALKEEKFKGTVAQERLRLFPFTIDVEVYLL